MMRKIINWFGEDDIKGYVKLLFFLLAVVMAIIAVFWGLKNIAHAEDLKSCPVERQFCEEKFCPEADLYWNYTGEFPYYDNQGYCADTPQREAPKMAPYPQGWLDQLKGPDPEYDAFKWLEADNARKAAEKAAEEAKLKAQEESIASQRRQEEQAVGQAFEKQVEEIFSTSSLPAVSQGTSISNDYQIELQKRLILVLKELVVTLQKLLAINLSR